MFGIVTKNYQVEFEKAIGESGVFHWDGSTIREQLDAAARTAIRTLLIDLACLSGDEGIKALRSYRRQRPTTRIILIGMNRTPGDPIIARCIAMGIYDVVNVEVEEEDEEQIRSLILFSLQQKLAQPAATYADAVRWELFDESVIPELPAKSEGKKERVIHLPAKEKVIIQERLIGTPIIAVTGAHPGAGTTYCALRIALMLSKVGSTAYVELDEGTNGFTRPQMQNPLLLNNVEIWRVPTLAAMSKRYNYIVLHAGCWPQRTEKVEEEIKRATRCFVTVGSSTWRYRNLTEQVPSLQEAREDWMVLVQSPSDKQLREIRKDLHITGWDVFPVPYQPDVFDLPPEGVVPFEDALSQFLPKKQENRNIFSRLFTKVRTPLRSGG
ncbi:hypothetical protein O3V59_21785 [Brevibacillus thermoruber]|uniref:Uncharacterized protein n=1 Tax=Brevibacillus thermoruber TaxID=33942 RepID=A0A9X3TU63_9BACL|nr:hypothetical protein [Brevibacillus thermoruber]MDA5110969.1 hypothetical protein [Brevibacillus thermoruber]